MKGYIAITTSITLALLIMIVAITLGSAHFITRFNISDFTDKQASLVLARSCLNYALLKLAENSNYAGNETINISSNQCAIRAIETAGSNKVIKSRGQLNGATTNLKLTVAIPSLSTVSLEEAVSF